MTDDPNPFPDWTKPAIKGDVIQAIIYLRAAMSDLAGAAVAQRLGNDAEAQQHLAAFFESDRKIVEILDGISGVES